MQIKEEKYKSESYLKQLFSTATSRLGLKWLFIIPLFLLLLAGISIASIYYGANLQQEGKIHYIKRYGQTAVKKPFSYVSNYIHGIGANPTKIQIDIKFEEYQKIAFQRELALKYGPSYRVHPSNPGYVPAKMSLADKTIPIKIRLKGGQVEHFGHEYKWSFKVKLKGSNSVKGMKFFSLQQAKNRGYLNEWILHKFLRYNGIIGVKYEFIELIVNGKNYGIYAMEENMAKQLIERNGRKEGPILNYNSDIGWDVTVGQAASFYGGNVNAYNEKDILENPTLLANYESARSLLELFRQDSLSVKQVFDIEKLATYFAIIDLTGFKHATSLNNMKFYYNPITGLVEPIGYDNGYFVKISQPLQGQFKPLRLKGDEKFDRSLFFKGNEWFIKLFTDVDFYKAYMRALNKISDKKLLDDFFEEVDDEMQANLKILHSEHYWYNMDGEFENPDNLYHNQRYIKGLFKPQKALQSHFSGYNAAEKKVELEIGNILSFPIEIIGINYKDSLDFYTSPISIIPSYLGKMTTYKKIDVSIPNGFNFHDSMLVDMKLNFRLLGTDSILTENIYPWSVMRKDFAAVDLVRQEPNFESFPFLINDKVNKIISFKAGNWEISEDVIIPKGYSVNANAGVMIDLINKASIFSYSPIFLRGTEEAPVIIMSSDSTGQGITVMTAQEESALENVIFKNLSRPSKATWSLSGAVSFYESPVRFNGVLFDSNLEGDDYLNVIRSVFYMENTTFYNTNSDAFDADFCQGHIINSKFIKSGNDAIDVSGSSIKVSHVTIDSVGDKAISGGEQSNFYIDNITIRNAELAITSKDKSMVKINNSTIEDTRVAYTAFVKKPEYGHSGIEVTNTTLKNIELDYLIEKGCYMLIDKLAVETVDEKVEDYLYGAKFGKKSIR